MHRLFPPPESFLQARRDALDSDRRIRIGGSSALTRAMSPGATVASRCEPGHDPKRVACRCLFGFDCDARFASHARSSL